MFARSKHFFFILSFMIMSTVSPAQETGAGVPPDSLSGHMVFVRTAGGGEFHGKVLDITADRLELIDGEGRIILLYRPAVISIEDLEAGGAEKTGRNIYFRDAAANRFFFMPTAFPVEPGELHLTDQELVAVTLSYGLTEHVSIWGGISLPGALANIRYSIRAGDRAALSFGSFCGTLWADPGFSAIMPYGIASFGVPESNVTAGIACPVIVSGDEKPYIGGIVAAIGWKTVISRTASLLNETWIIFNGEKGGFRSLSVTALPAAAFRIAGGRFSWDIGAIFPFDYTPESGFTGLGDGPFIPLPIAALTYRLN